MMDEMANSDPMSHPNPTAQTVTTEMRSCNFLPDDHIAECDDVNVHYTAAPPKTRIHPIDDDSSAPHLSAIQKAKFHRVDDDDQALQQPPDASVVHATPR